jgi:hypothetical protein
MVCFFSAIKGFDDARSYRSEAGMTVILKSLPAVNKAESCGSPQLKSSPARFAVVSSRHRNAPPACSVDHVRADDFVVSFDGSALSNYPFQKPENIGHLFLVSRSCGHPLEVHASWQDPQAKHALLECGEYSEQIRCAAAKEMDLAMTAESHQPFRRSEVGRYVLSHRSRTWHLLATDNAKQKIV